MKCRGVGLVELLVALALGAVVLLGSLRLVLLGRSHHHDQQALQRLHERARFTLSALEADLQLAGYFGLQPAAQLDLGAVPADAASVCGAGFAQQLAVPVTIAAAWPLTCPAAGSGVVPGSSVLVIRRASAQPAVAQAGRLQLQTSLAQPTLGRLLLDGSGRSGPDRELRDLKVQVYYLARRADGSEPGLTALRVKALTRVEGQPAFIDTEVAPGVTRFNARLIADPVSSQATLLELDLSWQADAPDRPGRPQTLSLTRRHALRNVQVNP
jgi:type IV pilus assembly protein PilW